MPTYDNGAKDKKDKKRKKSKDPLKDEKKRDVSINKSVSRVKHKEENRDKSQTKTDKLQSRADKSPARTDKSSARIMKSKR